jgi:uncharacterized protein YjbI with pentapeptide repeats
MFLPLFISLILLLWVFVAVIALHEVLPNSIQQRQKKIYNVNTKQLNEEFAKIPTPRRIKSSSRSKKKLTREDVKIRIEENGGAWGLDLSNEYMSDIDLSGMDLRGVNFSGATMYRANLSQAFLERTNFQETRCWRANMSDTSLWSADLRLAELTECNLQRASLHNAKLQEASLYGANLHFADLHNTTLSETKFTRSCLGKIILQENKSDYHYFLIQREKALIPFRGNRYRAEELERQSERHWIDAENIYRNLKNNFDQIGLYDDASWAYKHERRMRKAAISQQVAILWNERKYLSTINASTAWLSDWCVELLCDYGESIVRVILWLFAMTFIIGPVLIGLSGGLEWRGNNNIIYLSFSYLWQKMLYVYFQNILYMVDVLTTANFSELSPKNDLTRIISGVFAVLGVFLVGLLGFVAGNRIRNS